jgi:hypothetical protein
MMDHNGTVRVQQFVVGHEQQVSYVTYVGMHKFGLHSWQVGPLKYSNTLLYLFYRRI